MNRTHDEKCRCARCRHARFNPGHPTSSRRINFYGHFSRNALKRRSKGKVKLPKMKRMPAMSDMTRSQRIRSHIANLMFAKQIQKSGRGD